MDGLQVNCHLSIPFTFLLEINHSRFKFDAVVSNILSRNLLLVSIYVAEGIPTIQSVPSKTKNKSKVNWEGGERLGCWETLINETYQLNQDHMLNNQEIENLAEAYLNT